MHWIDWAIMILPVAICTLIAIKTRRYVRGVADFMAGGRNAGRFLICTARSEQATGAVNFVATFQVFLISGFTLSWWNQLSVPVGLFVAISGFVIYRYRQTRALTLAQFFEMRYSRHFRLFAGGLAFLAGLLNFGVIPVIGARFMAFSLGLPYHVTVLGFHVQSAVLLMIVFLSISTLMTTTGGQVTVLVTDCFEGMFSQLFFVLVAAVVLVTWFHWPTAKAQLLATPPGQSLVNPFDSFSLRDFNLWFVLMQIAVNVYGTMAWQNSHAFNSSAATPHESRMGSVLAQWRSFAVVVMVTLLSVCAVTYLKTPAGDASVTSAMANVGDASIIKQMRVPVALSQLLPIGAKGMLLAVCLMGIISGDGIHLHSWGSILVQDVILPLRKTPLSPKQHLTLLRCGIIFVAIFAVIFGATFPLSDALRLWWAVTQGIFTGGAGAAIIGGLYWSRGTTAGAWAGILLGVALSLGGIGARLYSEKYLGHEFALNGMQISFFSSIASTLTYVGVSLLTCKRPHDMDRLLHRGAWAVEAEAPSPGSLAPSPRRLTWLRRIVGIDEQFNRMDRSVTLAIFTWTIAFFLIFLFGSGVYSLASGMQQGGRTVPAPWNLIFSNAAWADYWLVTAIFLPLLVGVLTTVWFTIGCTQDLILFFRRLREETVNDADDGTVYRDAREERAAFQVVLKPRSVSSGTVSES